MGKTSKTKKANASELILAAEFEAVEERIDHVNKRVDDIAGAFPTIDNRIVAMDKRIEAVSERVGNAFDNIGAHNEALADIVNRIAALEKWCYPRMDVQPTLDRIAALENQIRDLNPGLRPVTAKIMPAEPAFTEPTPKRGLRETSEETVRHAAACIGTVGVLRALADYLGKGHALADTLSSATDYALKKRIVFEALEKVEAMG